MAEPGLSGLLRRFPALARLSRQRRRMPFVPQTTIADCGAACLGMVLRYFGKDVPAEELRAATGADRDGVSALHILEAGRRFGLRGRGVRVENVEHLAGLKTPAILHWELCHFVVLERWRRDGADIVDPAAGPRRISHAELRRCFTGIAVTLEPAPEFEPAARRPRGLWRFLGPILAEKGLMTRSLILSVLLQGFALVVPLLTAVLVDRVIPRGDHHLLVVISIGLAVITGFTFLSSLIRGHLLLELRVHLDTRLTLDFLDHLVDLPYAFFQQRSTGDLMMRLNSNARIREILTSTGLSGILDGILVSLYLVLLFLTSLSMSLLVLLLASLRVGLFAATRRRFRTLMAQSLQTQARSRDFQIQLLSGIETLKTMGAEKKSVDSWANLFVDELNVSLDQGRLNNVFDSLLSALGSASPMAILVLGSWQVLEGQLTLGTMLALNALAAGFLNPLSSLISTAVQLQLLGGYLERIQDVFELPREQEEDGELVKPSVGGAISLQDVGFRYGPNAPEVVRKVSVDISPGTFVAIVGGSGAGKSTLARLLIGLYPPNAGRILFDGVDLLTLELRALRQQIGVVPQQPFLLGASVRDNIALGHPEVPQTRIVEVAKLAQIHDDILAMPLGYETLVTGGGAALSGGQRQRIALARALIHRPAILLLDEATSSVDAVTERRIQDELALLRCTRVVIAHRLSTIRNADLILVMENGRIIERGTHRELLRRRGRYQALVAAQTNGSSSPVADGEVPARHLAKRPRELAILET